MKAKYRNLGIALLSFMPFAAFAQTSIDFEDASSYKSIGVYDSWEDSPFRTGALKGNVAVVKNHLNTEVDEVTGEVKNASSKILAVQRSRFGSNTFGARVDLNEPFELSPTQRYVHVSINRPVDGRVMLIGLGKRTDRPGQSADTEQFWVLSNNTVEANTWTDAVFPIKGANGVQIYSFVIVPECESTHDLTADFAAYIDNIEVNDDSKATNVHTYYAVNTSDGATLSRSDRYTSAVGLTNADGTVQSISVPQQSDKLVYQKLLSKTFQATAGEKVTPSITYAGNWMHGYVYLDKIVDGKFNFSINENGTPTDSSEIMSYSYYKERNSEGADLSSNMNPGWNPAAFTVPASLSKGFYRMRYKVDWDCIDAGGNMTGSNDIDDNGGVIVDVRLNVHEKTVSIKRAGGLNGDILTEDGSQLTNLTHNFGEEFTVKSSPAPGFKLSKIRVRHGYNLDGDSLVYGTPQYVDEYYAAYLFDENSSYTIPAEIIDGDIQIEPYFVSESSAVDSNDYPLNFEDDLTVSRTDRHLDSFALSGTNGGSASFTVPSGTNYVYRNLTPQEASVVPGDEVTTTATYTGNSMHLYLYVDLDQDGQFTAAVNSDGTPTTDSELLSYTYYNGLNSKGETKSAPGAAELHTTMPTFTIPANLPEGNYRARLKVDWDNIDPAGQWSENGSNQINDNGGQIVDFLINVHAENSKLDINTSHGAIVGNGNTGVSPTIAYATSITLLPYATVDGYEAENVTIRHGHKLDGAQYVHGNRQWSEYTVSADKEFSLPSDSVNGDVRITANFEPTSSATYGLAFSDDFNQEDGSAPDVKKWTRPTKSNATWKRFAAGTTAGRAETAYIEDGKLVTLCKPNKLEAEKDADGKQLAMISGVVESNGKFAYKYGKVEGRLMTEPYSGNFPAFWMMPQNQSDGWPYCGEIDIWEQIDAQDISYHTIHSKWANTTADGSECQGQTNNPAKSGSNSTVNGQYHTFALDWTESLLTWYVDGKKVFSYAKSTNQDDLDKGQWPFDKEFYLILNQSVGNGSWAAKADESHTYKTLFDWVRVYQSDVTVGIDQAQSAAAGLDWYVSPGKVRLVSAQEQNVRIYDAQGRTMFNENVQGNRDVRLQRGVYVINGDKVIVP